MSTAHPTRRRIRKKSYRVLIAGCGDVGGALGRELAADGHQVFGLRRRVAALPEEITPYEADLGRPETLRDLPPALDYVVYAAAADETSEPAYRRAYVEGVDHLLAALDQQHQAPRRLLFTSSTGVYGQSDGSWVDEDSPTEPTRFTGELVLAGERRIAAGPWPATAVRFGGIYGPGRTRLIRRVQAGGLEVDRSRPLYTNRIHRDDCAGVLAHLLERDLAGEPVPAVVLGVDNEPAPRHEVYDWLADRLGVPRPAEAGAAPSTTPGRLHGGSKRCSNLGLRSLGYTFRFPTFREGYEALLSGSDHDS